MKLHLQDRTLCNPAENRFFGPVSSKAFAASGHRGRGLPGLQVAIGSLCLLCTLLGSLCGCAHQRHKEGSHITTLGSKASGYRIQGRFAPDGTLVPQSTATTETYGYRTTHVRGSTVQGIARAQIGVLNTHSRSLTLQYRVFWYDAQGLDLGPSTQAWETLTLEQQTEVTLSLVAPAPAATEFVVYLRTLPAPRRL